MPQKSGAQSDQSGGRWALALIVLVLATNVPPYKGGDSASSTQDGLGVTSLEVAISRRMSVRRYLETPMPWEILSEVLWAGYGYSLWERTTANLCGNHPIVIYVCNQTAAYIYQPEEQTLRMHREGDFRRWGARGAPIQLFLVLNRSRYSDVVWASSEAGCIGQNIYLAANAVGLGTVCIGGGINRSGVHDALSLSPDEEVLYNMPLGYPETPYDFAPSEPPQSPELPMVLEGSMSLREALLQAVSSHDWSESTLTRQEQSQILWAAYGFSLLRDLTQLEFSYNIGRHRTVPSAHNSYALTLLVLNESGTYSYTPSSHSLRTVREGDERGRVTAACGRDWVVSASLVLAVVWNSESKNPTESFACYETGCVIQNIRLESVSWGLVSDSVRVPDEDAMRGALGLAGQTNLHPISIIAVGHPSTYRYKILNATRTVSIATNSTVTNFGFDRRLVEGRLSLEESFNVTGTPGTAGFCNTTIPVEFIKGFWPRPSVSIDGLKIDHIAARNSTHLSLYFVYNHNAPHRVHIVVEYVDPPDVVLPVALLLATAVALIVYLSARMRSRPAAGKRDKRNEKIGRAL